MAVPIRRRIPGKGFQNAVIGILILGGLLTGFALTFIIALGGWNPGDELILIMGSGTVFFFAVLAATLRATWAKRERIARAEGRPIPDNI